MGFSIICKSHPVCTIWTFKDFIVFYGENVFGWICAEYAVHKERYEVQMNSADSVNWVQ